MLPSVQQPNTPYGLANQYGFPISPGRQSVRPQRYTNGRSICQLVWPVRFAVSWAICHPVCHPVTPLANRPVNQPFSRSGSHPYSQLPGQSNHPASYSSLRPFTYLFINSSMYTFTRLSTNSPTHPSFICSLHASILPCFHPPNHPSFIFSFHSSILPSFHPPNHPSFLHFSPPYILLSLLPSIPSSLLHPSFLPSSPVRHFSAIAPNHTQKFNGSPRGVAKHFYCDREAIRTFYSFFFYFTFFLSFFLSLASVKTWSFGVCCAVIDVCQWR